MGNVYSPPKSVPVPSYNMDTWREDEEKFMKDLTAWVKAHSTDKYAGEIIRFHVADGYAVYMVMSLKPIKLIHVPLGDAWQFEYVHRLTAADIKARIRREHAIRAAFKKK